MEMNKRKMLVMPQSQRIGSANNPYFNPMAGLTNNQRLIRPNGFPAGQRPPIRPNMPNGQPLINQQHQHHQSSMHSPSLNSPSAGSHGSSRDNNNTPGTTEREKSGTLPNPWNPSGPPIRINKKGKRSAPTAYAFFRHATIGKIRADRPGLTFAELNKELADKWKGMKDEDKAPWEEDNRKTARLIKGWGLCSSYQISKIKVLLLKFDRFQSPFSSEKTTKS